MKAMARLVYRDCNNYFRRGLRRGNVITARLDPLQVHDDTLKDSDSMAEVL